MELVINPHPVLGSHIQHTIPSTLFYPGKDSPWQPVVTSMASLATMADVPKESIIANTDFTTTSLIAKRRLSSKKRKNLERQQSEGEGRSPDAQSTGTPSPTSYTPTVTSITGTSPAPEKCEPQPMQVSHSLANGFQSTSIASSVASSITHMVHQHTHTHTHHIAPPPSQAGVIPLKQSLQGGQYHVSLAAPAGTCYPVAPSMMPAKQFADPVFNHLQQELNYRFLQEQSGAMVMPSAAFNQLPHPQPHPQSQAQVAKAISRVHSIGGQSSEDGVSDTSKPVGFKWCCAHVIIAKQIQQHQDQTKAVALAQSKDVSRQHPNGQNLQSDLVAQQQLALLQMYGLQPNAAAMSGYMAVPYSMQEVQMRMQSFMQPAPMVSTAGISLVKQAAGVPNQMVAGGALDSDLNLHMVNGIHLQAPFTHVPVATLAPNDLSNAVMHGSTTGSWIAPVPVIGSCIINPFQPGIMPTSWVK